MPTANVNIVAVLIAALLTFVLGAFWYSPILFARQWMQAQGYTPEKIAERRKEFDLIKDVARSRREGT